ncbi:hypothetical protein GQ53DRAFT_801142 [Thozetella sp. PMI_491]|nr:hypothetical protein GQ53DRAFT_801142 [Thozetella sp. PMI_491]
MMLRILFLLSTLGLSSAIPPPVPHGPRDPGLLPAKDPNPAHYAVDVTWTVTTTKQTVAPEATSVRIRATTITSSPAAPTTAAVTATLMGIKSTGVFYWPPPEITATVGQRIRITLTNELTTTNVKGEQEEVTLHFHGLYQENGYGFMDGPEGIAQCGVKQGETFVYDFPAKRPGTYWLHSHDPGQYPKGLRTALIILEQGTSPYAADNIVTLSDWYPDFWRTEQIYNQKEAANPYEGCGNGGDVLGPAFAATFNDYVPGIHTSKSRFYQIKNGANRFRFINLSAFSPFFIQFEGHRVTVIELDGVLVDAPGDTEGFVVMPGQRASVIVNSVAANQPKDPRFMPNDGSGTKENCILPNRDGSITAYTWGCFYYGDIAPSECPVPGVDAFPFVGYKLQGPSGNPRLALTLNASWHWDMQTPAAYPWDYNEKLLGAKADQPGYSRDQLLSPAGENVHFLYLGGYSVGGDPQNAGYGSMSFGTAATELWTKPPAWKGPGFIQAVQGNNTNYNQASSYGGETNTIIVKNQGDVVWLLIETGMGDHPIHLHGHHFQLLYKGFEDPASIAAYRAAVQAYKSAPAGTPPAMWEKFRTAVGLVTPAKPVTRDTILAQKYQFMIIAFKADNPGVWALHCHNDFHASTGMVKQVIVAPQTLREAVGTFDISDDGTTISYTAPSGGASVDQAVVEAMKRNAQQCHPGSALS